MKVIAAAELLNRPLPTDIELAAENAESAARILRKIASGESPKGRLDSATWRLADALYLLRGKGKDLPGIDKPTGMGAKLKD